MADNDYWTERASRLDDPTIGAFAASFFPVPDDALIGKRPFFAVSNALRLLVLDRKEDAQRLLNDFLPRLTSRLSDDHGRRSLAAVRNTGEIASLAEHAHLAVWLTEGAFTSYWGRLAYDLRWKAHREFSPRARLDGPELLHMMLLLIETGDPASAKELYSSSEAKPLALPPSSLRFSRNPRTLLFAHLNSDLVSAESLDAAFRAFHKAATQWQHDLYPIPFVGIVEAARIFWACYSLRAFSQVSNPFCLSFGDCEPDYVTATIIAEHGDYSPESPA